MSRGDDARRAAALDHARRLAAPQLRSRGASSAPTDLYTMPSEPEQHLGSEIERHRQALALTIEVTARGEDWRRWVDATLAGLALATGASFGLAVLSLTVLVLWRWG